MVVSTATLRPNSAVTTNLTPAGDTPNYECVDEASSDGLTTYVVGVASSSYDIYGFPAASVSGVVVSVTVRAMVGRTNTNLRFARTKLVVGGVTYDGLNPDITTDPNTFAEISTSYIVNPYTGLTWESGDVAALQAGVELEGTSVMCTQIWIEVNYVVGSLLTVLNPDANGSHIGLDAPGAGTNWENVSDGATTYVYKSAAGTDYDLYTIEDLAVGGTPNIYSVRVVLKGKCSNTYNYVVATELYTHSTLYTGNDVAMQYAAYTYGTTEYTVNPNTSSAWTSAEVNALEAGVRVFTAVGAGTFSYVHEMWVEVIYTVSPIAAIAMGRFMMF